VEAFCPARFFASSGLDGDGQGLADLSFHLEEAQLRDLGGMVVRQGVHATVVAGPAARGETRRLDLRTALEGRRVRPRYRAANRDQRTGRVDELTNAVDGIELVKFSSKGHGLNGTLASACSRA
jgi:hypothetical protein